MAKAPYEHFLLAEEALADAYEVTADQADYFLVKAQVHATLATVDAAVWDAAKREADAASAEAGESE
jgi:hypothetical protein